RAQDPESDKKSRERKIIERNRTCERPWKPEVRARNRRNAIISLSHCHPSVGKSPNDHAESESNHEEVNSAGAQRHQPENCGNGQCKKNARRQCDPKAGSIPRRQNTHAISAETEISGMTERSKTGIAENDIEAHRDYRVDQRLGQQREQKRGEKRRPK